MDSSIRFGFLPEESSYMGGGLVVQPLVDIHERISGVWSSGRVDGVWLHPPLIERKGLQGFSAVSIHSQVYTVPATHLLRTTQGNRGKPLQKYELFDLIIAVIGLLKGLRLIPEGWNHFYKTPVQIGFLVDFYCDDSQIGPAMEQGVAFWNDNSESQIARRMFAALHWFLTSQSYDHEFELFAAQYMVLDTCWWIFCSSSSRPINKVKHAERTIEICDHFEIPVPEWAVVSNGSSFLSTLRNELLHGGFFAKSPVGFEFPAEYPDIDLELRDLNSRLLMALLGLRSSYIQSKINRGYEFRISLQ